MRGGPAIAAGLAAAGLAAGAVGLAGTAGSVHATAHAYVNDDRPETLDAHNSPAGAADPAHPERLVVADRIDTPASSCALYGSDNAGVNWRRLDLPLAADAPNCFWPDVAWNADGEALVLYGATGGPNNQPVGTWVQRLAGGAAAGPPVRVSGADAFHPRLAAAGAHVVATWVQAGPATAARSLGLAPEPNPVVAAVSTDGGRTFGAPVRVSDPALRVVVPSVVTGGGTVVVSGLDLGDDQEDYSGLHQGRGGPAPAGRWRVLAWTSRDGGATWGPAAVVAEVAIPQRIHVDLGAPRPGLARDPGSGSVYATWESGAGPARDVFLARSDDGGRSWSPPRAVVRRRGTQNLPAVDVAAGGRVDVVFYDRSGDPEDVRTEVAQASSWDGGRTFAVAAVSRRRFDARIGLGSYQGLPILGTQTEVVAGAGGATALWSDTLRATRDDNRQDLGVALVAVAGPGRLRPVPLGAAAVLLAGAGAVARGSARRRRG